MSDIAAIEPSSLAYSAEIQYAQLPARIKREVDLWLPSVLRVIEGKPKSLAIAREAEFLSVQFQRPVSAATVRAKVSLFEKMGRSYRAFINWSKMPHQENNLPTEFLEWYLVTVCGGNQRKNRPAHSKLIRHWQGRKEIPGYRGKDYTVDGKEKPELDYPMAYPGTDMPWGWTYSNLQKALRKNPYCRFLLTMRRQGSVAACALLPNVCLSTRVDIKPGQFYMPDDRWIDCDIIVAGQTEPARPIELGFGDVASTKKVCWGIKPQLRTRRKGPRERTKLDDMRLLLAQLLCLIGYHKDGVTFIIEHGTATIPEELILLLCQLSGGEVVNGKIVREGFIKVHPSGMQGGLRMMGGYLGKRLGNFKAKASYESSHNLYHNESADLPGQKGKDPAHAPEDDGAVANESKRLLTMMLALRPDLREHIKFHHLHFKAFMSAYIQLKNRIEDRTNHRIQNWEECGYVIAEYRVTYDPNGWRPRSELAAMPPVQRQAIEALIEKVPYLKRTRRMSPNEVWERGLAELTVLPIHCMRLILGEGLMEVHAVQKNGEFVFKRTDVSEDPLHFVAIADNGEGVETVLQPGREYRTWLNDFNPDMLFVEEMGGANHGRYLGICKPVPKAGHGDDKTRHAAVRAAEARFAKASAPYVAQGQKLLQQREAQLDHNTSVISGGPLTDAERRAEETRLAEPLDPSDVAALRDTPASSPTPEPPTSDLSAKDFI
jgi:hypothetical protein